MPNPWDALNWLREMRERWDKVAPKVLKLAGDGYELLAYVVEGRRVDLNNDGHSAVDD